MNFVKRAKDNFFILNGRSSADWDIVCSSDTTYNAPARDIKAIQVPGRNGELHIDNGRWQNVDLTYNDCVIESDFGDKFDDFRAYCARQIGYHRLEDTFHPDEYRLADMTQGIKVKKLGTRYNSGRFDLTFNCKPQRFLKSGEEPTGYIPVIPNGNTFMTPKYALDPDITYVYESYVGVTVTKAPTDSIDVMTYWYNPDLPDSYHVVTRTLTLGQKDIITRGLLNPYGDTAVRVAFQPASGYTMDDYEFFIEGRNYDADSDTYTDFNGIWARTFYIVNPTGFKCRPIFKCIGPSFPLQSVELESGEYWSINCDDYSNLTTEVIIDCENEYMYYIDSNGKKVNLTNYMTITHYDEDGNEVIPSFPYLGEGTTTFTEYVMGASAENYMFYLYPHWFTI